MDQGEGQSQEVTSEAPVEARISALADRFRSPKQGQAETETQEPQTEEASEETVETTEEVESEEPQGQTEEADDLIEYDHKGTKLKIPKDLHEGHLRQADYTRKTQAVAERSRVVEERERTLMQTLQLSEHLAPALGQLSGLDAQIQALHSKLTPELENNDPMQFSALGTRLSLLMQQRGQFIQGIEGYRNQLVQQMDKQRKLALQERLQEALPKVQSAIKGFDGNHAKQVAEYAKTQGFSSEELEHISFSAPAVISLWKAKEYDRLQAAKASTKPKLANLPPTAKPGGRNSMQSEESVRAKELKQEWRKGGGKDADMLAAILRNKFRSK